jgi:hypothetical protein
MFGLHHDTTAQLNTIDNPSLLYHTSDELLTSALLTPDPDPKFDISGTKADDAPFGPFDTLGIYDQYQDSGPSSVQFGDGFEPSEHGGSHLSMRDDSSAAASAFNNGHHARANGAGQLPLARYNNIITSPQHQNGIGDDIFGPKTILKAISPPSQQFLLDDSTPMGKDFQYDNIQVKT